MKSKMKRIKIESGSTEAVYLCTAHVLRGVVIDDAAKEVFRSQIWQAAEFHGVRILTHAIMPDHFHVLVRVPQKTDVSDAELIRRYRVMHPKPAAQRESHLNEAIEQLKTGGPVGKAWRKQQLGRMGDLSPFIKSVKQNFSSWYNRAHERFGTLWCGLYKSTLVEGRGDALALAAAYVDLSAVRAGIVSDPKEYPFCGYAAAVAGNKNAREGVMAVFGGEGGGSAGSWRVAREACRKLLYGAGGDGAVAAVTPAMLRKALEEKTTLPLAGVLRCPGRYFPETSVLGSKEFVTKYLAAYRRVKGGTKRVVAHPLPPLADWGDVFTASGWVNRGVE